MRNLAAWCHDRHRAVIGLWVAAIVLAGALAGGAGGGYVDNFSLPGSESQKAVDLLKAKFPQAAGDSSQIVFKADAGTLADAAVKRRITAVVQKVSKLPSVSGVSDPYDPKARTISPDGRIGFATLQFDKQADDLEKSDVKRVIETAQDAGGDGLEVNLGGFAIKFAEQQEQSATELIGIVVAIVVLVVVLGSFTAMAMPLIVAFAALAVAMSLVFAASALFDIAGFAPSLAVMIALGVGIDYALLVINRFRGERTRGAEIREATITAMDSAGRTVLFAGTTVVIALLGMLLLGLSFLNGPAVASALAVALTMFGALTLLPALLGSRMGRRVKLGTTVDAEDPRRPFGRWARTVQDRPHVVALVSLAVLLVVASPVLGMRLGSSDSGGDAPDTTTRKAYDTLAEGFGPGFNGPLLIVAQVEDRATGAQSLQALKAAVAKTKGVAAVGDPFLNAARDTATLTAFPTSKPQDQATDDLLDALRDDVIPGVEKRTGLDVSVGGSTATNADFSQKLTDKLPLFIGVIVGLSLLLLTVVFRSFVIPAKAAVMNILSVGASLGVITFVFQDGHLASLIGVETTGPIESFFPVFLFSVVFGLSMDYEVFLVSRMHEEWEKRGDATAAVRRGLALTGKVIMAAAIIMISVFASFMLGGDRTIKLFGLGLASAILFDAFVIRLALVPALMFLFGERSWWMPAGLARRLPKLSVEGPSEDAAPAGGHL